MVYFRFKKPLKNSDHFRMIGATSYILDIETCVIQHGFTYSNSVNDMPSHVEYNMRQNRIIEMAWHKDGTHHRTCGPSMIILNDPGRSYLYFVSLYYHIDGAEQGQRNIVYQDHITDDLLYRKQNSWVDSFP